MKRFLNHDRYKLSDWEKENAWQGIRRELKGGGRSSMFRTVSLRPALVATVTMVALVVMGVWWIDTNQTDKIRERRHDQLPTYGVGTEWNRAQWQAIFRQMMGRDLVRPDPERHGALRMTEAALPILRGEAEIELRKDTVRKAARRPAVKAMVNDEDAPLLSALKAKRRALAEAARVPAYVIFPDRTLIEMAEKRPASLDQMARIGGIGAKKLERYGALFLEVVSGAAEALHPARRKLAGRQTG